MLQLASPTLGPAIDFAYRVNVPLNGEACHGPASPRYCMVKVDLPPNQVTVSSSMFSP